MAGPANQPTADWVSSCPSCGRLYPDGVDFCSTDAAKLVTTDRSAADRIGTVISGRYHVKSILGTGGMGTVYRAVQEPIGWGVAIKVLHRDLARDKTFVNRFCTEAKAASVLVNPYTVKIHDFGQTDDGTMFIAMEHLRGISLADRLSRGALPWNHGVAIGIQVCRGLAEAHRKGIVHRDLKPENIMITAADDGSLLVKVLDFGIAKVLDAPGRKLTGVPVTQVGVIIGTPQYMSPEQARGGEPSPASDLYALGIILFECISGSAPFNDDEAIVTLSLHMRSPVPALASPFGAVPYALSNLIGALLRKDPKTRPGPTDLIGTMLRQIASEVDVSAKDVTNGPAARIRLAVAPDDEEEIDLTAAVETEAESDTADIAITRLDRQLPDISRQRRGPGIDDDPTILTELPPRGAAGTGYDDFDDETPPQEVSRRAFFSQDGADEDSGDEPRSRDDDATSRIPLPAEPIASPVPPSVRVVSPPRQPAVAVKSLGDVPPVATLSDDMLDDVEEVTKVPVGRYRFLVVLVAVILVVIAGAATGVLVLDDVPVFGRRDHEPRTPVTVRTLAADAHEAPSRGLGAFSDGSALAKTEVVPLPPVPVPTVTPDGATTDTGPVASGEAPTPESAAEPEGPIRALADSSEPTTAVLLVTRPTGAKVYDRDGVICDETPCEVSLPTGKTIRLRFVRADGSSATRTLVPGRQTGLNVDLSRRRRPPPATPPQETDLQPWLD